jgi:dihydropteroate synthase
VATHIRLAPRVADPNPHYDDVVTDVCEALLLLAKRAESARIPPQRIIVDPGLDLGKTCQQSLRLLAATCKFASLGYPMMLAVSNKIFLGRLLGLRKQERQHATLAACTTGVERGARLLRVHEVLPVRQAVDLLAAIYEAT